VLRFSFDTLLATIDRDQIASALPDFDESKGAPSWG